MRDGGGGGEPACQPRQLGGGGGGGWTRSRVPRPAGCQQRGQRPRRAGRLRGPQALGRNCRRQLLSAPASLQSALRLFLRSQAVAHVNAARSGTQQAVSSAVGGGGAPGACMGACRRELLPALLSLQNSKRSYL